MGTDSTAHAAASPPDALSPPSGVAAASESGTSVAGAATCAVGPRTLSSDLTALHASSVAASQTEAAQGDALGLAWQRGFASGIDDALALVAALLRRLEDDRDRLRRCDCPGEAAGLTLAIRLMGGAR